MSNLYYLWSNEYWKLLFLPFKKNKNVNEIKKYIFIIIDTLPCIKCKNHFYEMWTDNNLFSSNDINEIYAFLINVYNLYVSNKINIENVKLL